MAGAAGMHSSGLNLATIGAQIGGVNSDMESQMAKEQITFVELDPATLPEECQVLWAELLAKKAEFKASLQGLAPAGKRVQFVEKYGKLKIALSTVAQAKAQTQSLAEFLAAQQGNGHAV